MLNRPHYIALGVVLLLTIVLLKLPTRAKANLKLAISGLFLPADALAGSSEDLAVRSSYALLSRDELIRQLQEQQKTNQLWQIYTRRAEEWKRENDRLRDALGLQRQYPWKLKPARVVGRDPANWWKSITLDRGSRDGVALNSPVLSGDGLVGHIAEVGVTQSRVA